MKEKLTELKGNIDISTIIEDYYYTSLKMYGTTRKMISKEIEDLIDTIN